MKLRTKLLLITGGLALLVLSGTLLISVFHMRHTADQIREAGKEHSRRVVTNNSRHSVEVVRNLFENERQRFVLADFPAADPAETPDAADFPVRTDVIIFSPRRKTGEHTHSARPERGFRLNDDGSVLPLSREEIADFNKTLQQVLIDLPDAHKKHHGAFFLHHGGHLWIATHRDSGSKPCSWYFFRLNKNRLAQHIYLHTQTHIILLDAQKTELLSTKIPAELDLKKNYAEDINAPDRLPDITDPYIAHALDTMTNKPANELISIETEKLWFCVAAKLNFPELGLHDLRLVRVFDVPVMSPEVTAQIEKNLARFHASIFFLLGMGLILILLPLIFFSRRISAPIERAAKFADTLANGDFPTPMPADKSGVTETAQLVKSLNFMRDKLTAMINKLNRKQQHEQKARLHAEQIQQQHTDFIRIIADNISTHTGNGIELTAMLRENRDLQQALESQFGQLQNAGSLLRLLSRINSEPELDVTIFELFPMIRDKVDSFKNVCNDRKIELRRRYDADIPKYVRIDRKQLDKTLQLAGETIINSTSADSFLLFSVENDRENARIIFGLSGCNSNSAIRAYLDNAPRDFAAASAVIRLSVIRHLTELLGGEFDAEIRQDGSFGIRISFLREELEDTDGDTAKRHHRAETIQAHTEKVRLPVPDGKKMQILIVPMDDADRMLLQLMLRNIPECEMVTADDITSAEAILSNGDTCFNAVIFDPAQNDPAPERKLEKLRSAAAKKTGFIVISSGDSFRHADVTLRKPLKYTVLLESVMFFRS